MSLTRVADVAEPGAVQPVRFSALDDAGSSDPAVAGAVVRLDTAPDTRRTTPSPDPGPATHEKEQ